LYCLSFFDLRLLVTSLVSSNCSCSLSFGHCIAFLSLIYSFWLPLWYLQTALVLFLLVIVLPFFLWFTASDYPFSIFKLLLFSFFWSLYCFSFFDLRLLVTSLVSSNWSCSFSFGHCIAFLSLFYGFWLPLWYLQNALVLFLLVIVLPFFLWFTASDYLFGIFKLVLFSFLWSLYCLSFFDLQLLITSFISSNCSCSLSFGHCIAFLSLIYSFWLPLWYLQNVLVLFLLVIVLPFFLWFTTSDYLFGIFKPVLFSFFWSLYCLSFFDLRFWLPLWYLQTVLVLFLLVIVLPFFLWFTASDYLFGIF
jgi:hypothetical protein